MSGPVTLNHRRVGCRNSRWTVFLDDISDDRGRRVPDFLVLQGVYMRDALVTGSAVLPVLDGKVALMRNYRHPVEGFCWEMVKGFIDEGESAPQAALRELGEETGLSCAPADLIALGSFLPESAAIAGRGMLFLARDCRLAGRPVEDEIGLGRMQLFALPEVMAMARDSRIEDAATLVALLRAQPHLGLTG